MFIADRFLDGGTAVAGHLITNRSYVVPNESTGNSGIRGKVFAGT